MELDIFLLAKNEKGLTYEQIGEPLGLKKPEIYTILHGTRAVSLKKLLTIGSILSVPPEKTAELYYKITQDKAIKNVKKMIKNIKNS